MAEFDHFFNKGLIQRLYVKIDRWKHSFLLD